MSFKKKIRSNKWYMLLAFLLILGCVFICVYCRDSVFNSVNFIYNNREEIGWYIIPLSIAIGIVDTIFGDPKEHSLNVFKFLPVFLASPLSCLTYGVVICSSMIFLHIVFFTPQLFSPYILLDRVTLTCSFVILFLWAIVEITKIIIDLFNKKVTGTEGTIDGQKE